MSPGERRSARSRSAIRLSGLHLVEAGAAQKVHSLGRTAGHQEPDASVLRRPALNGADCLHETRWGPHHDAQRHEAAHVAILGPDGPGTYGVRE